MNAARTVEVDMPDGDVVVCSCGRTWTPEEFAALPALLDLKTGLPWIIVNDAPCDCGLFAGKHQLDCESLTKTVDYEGVLCDRCGSHRSRLVERKSEARQQERVPVRCKARVQTGHRNTLPPQCSKTTTAPSGYCASHKYLEGS